VRGAGGGARCRDRRAAQLAAPRRRAVPGRRQGCAPLAAAEDAHRKLSGRRGNSTAARRAGRFEARAPARPGVGDLPVLPAGGRRPRRPAVGAAGSLTACAGMPGDEPAWRRPVASARPFPGGAVARCDRSAGGAGARRWGRSGPGAQERPDRLTRALRRSPATLPHPAWRTPAPCLRRHAPARGTSACAGGGMRSAGGTCVRKATTAVGRNCGKSGVETGQSAGESL
jgi:hypothetical protein